MKRGRPKKEDYKEAYSVILKFGATSYSAEGTSVAEAISRLKPGVIKTIGVIQARKGDLVSERRLKAPLIKRMILYPTFRAIYAKQLTTMLK